MAKYYLDTSIWLDYYEKRGTNGEAALKLIMRIIKDNHILGISDLNVSELKHLGYSKNQIAAVFNAIRPKNGKRLHITREQLEEAGRIARKRYVPKKDALHAILYRDYEFQLITTDTHFEKLKDVADVKRPEEVT